MHGSIQTREGLTLGYEEFHPTHGRIDGPPLLMVMGLGAQMLLWPDGLCQHLADAGHRVIRFDNRDVGLSSKLDDHGTPNIPKLYLRRKLGLSLPDAPYTLADMAHDAVDLIDGLGLDRVCAIGASMGGMIVQRMAIHHPERLVSAVSIMSSVSPATPESRALRMLLRRPGPGRENAIAHSVRWFRVIGSQSMPIDFDELAKIAGKAFDRGASPDGFARQLMAVIADGSRAQALERTAVPFLVLHGDEDPLIPLSYGIRTASVTGARMRVMRGMGHDLPTPLWPQYVDEISGHARAF